MYRISILGAGPVAQFFYKELAHLPEIKIVQCYNRKGLKLHRDQPPSQIITKLAFLTRADLYLIAVTDTAIEEVAKKIPFKKVNTVHTSGATDINILSKQTNRGVWYPLQTFSENAKIDARKVPVCLEASNENLLQLLKELSLLITPLVYQLTSRQRLHLHLAAVFSNNFVNHLMTISQDICKDQDIPFELLVPLVKKTMNNAIDQESKYSQTGPAVRKDQKTIENHLNLLPSPRKKIYHLLTEAIQDYYGKEL